MGTSRQRRSVVLLVQPHDDSRTVYRDFLRSRGIRTICPTRAINAMKLASRADVIVTGVLLDDTINGLELIARLRDDARTKEKPIIVLAGCDVFLAKPCLPDDLLREIRRVSRRSFTAADSEAPPCEAAHVKVAG